MPFDLGTGAGLLCSAVDHAPNFPTNAMVLRRDIFTHHRFLESAPALNQDWFFVYTALVHEPVYGIAEPLVRVRVHQGGNALQVGMRAYLSTALVMHEIAQIFEQRGERAVASRARFRERWIPRNAFIVGAEKELEELLALPEENLFGSYFRLVMKRDGVLRTMTQAPQFIKPALRSIMRVLRRVQKA